MRLKSLEVKGLKSFAEHTVVNFNESITGIVGPNGCGKSNIVDAIRWVLGEQKPTRLRVEKMEDLVFNGTKNRKAGAMAEVALTFENTKNILPTEYKEVTIKRIMYRGGDTEYKINEVSCRLKDISNLFLDTGINSDSYAIIELGMVDDILKDVDNSRRKIFEQAAGISKYKVRKKETLSKLNATDADLNRIQDLLFEIENQLQMLEKQAKRTQQYYKLKEQYKNYSKIYARIALSTYKENNDNWQKQENENQDTKRAIETELATLESKLSALKLESIQYQQLLRNDQQAMNAFLDELRKKENERNIVLQRLDFIDKQWTQYQQQIEKNKNQLNQLNQSTTLLISRIESEQKLVNDADINVSLKKAELTEKEQHLLQKNQTMLEAERDFQTAEKAYIDLEKNIAVNQSQRNNIIKNIHLRKEEGEHKKQALQTLIEKIQIAEQEKNTIEKEWLTLKESEEVLQQQCNEIQHNLDQKRQALNEQNRILSSKQTEYNVLKRLMDNMEGFPDSIKFLKQKDTLFKNIPLLGDIVSTDANNKIAVTMALEPYLNYFVVPTWDIAYHALQTLQENKKGKVNILVLEAFENWESPSQKPTLGNAMFDVLKYDETYKKVLSWLTHNIAICNKPMKEIEIKDKFTYIDKDGAFLIRQNSITGGEAGIIQSGKLGKSIELEQLDKEIKKLSSEMENERMAIAKQQQELNELKLRSQNMLINELNSKNIQAGNQVVRLNTTKEQDEQYLATYHLQFQSMEEEVVKLDEQIDIQQKNYYQIQNQRNDKTQIHLSSKEAYQQALIAFNKVKDEYAESNLQYNQQKNRVSSLNIDLGYQQQQMEQLNKELAENEVNINNLITEKTDKEIQHTDIEQNLLKAYKDQENIKQEVSTKEQAYYTMTAEIDQWEKKIKELQRNKENAEHVINNLKDQANEMKFQLTSIRERLSIEFNLDINEVLAENNEEDKNYDRESIQIKVESAKRKLDTFGEFNPMAYEAYQEMKLRYDNIVMQKDDLQEAKNALLQTIREIDKVAKENFMDSFVKIRENFIKVFRSLFTQEDDCDLVLENPDDPLESNIEIIAKPKGKRPQNISQLSGGEKTLTATALLFSIYLIKPAPFCIFDEVDAPLDDTNIEKFNKIIKEFSKNSQFIVVTHNKMTMAAVDIMYGVTMVEAGVSKLVPVDFRHLN